MTEKNIMMCYKYCKETQVIRPIEIADRYMNLKDSHPIIIGIFGAFP